MIFIDKISLKSLKPLKLIDACTVNSRLADTSIKQTIAKSPAKANYGRLIEINCRYYGLSLRRTRIRGPYSIRYKVSRLCIYEIWCS